MKFSFSTKGWQQLGWQRLTELARDVRLSGIELPNIFDAALFCFVHHKRYSSLDV